MTDTTDTPAPEITRDQFRTTLLLHLPEPATVHTYDDVLDPGPNSDLYEPTALAAWADARVEEFIEAERTELRAAWSAEVQALEASAARVVEAATAAGHVAVARDVIVYLANLEKALKSNLSLSDQWDLGRTVGVERDRMAGVIAQLFGQFPFLAAMLAAPDQGLVLPGEPE